MARTVLRVGSVVWLAAALVGFGAATVGAGWLPEVLPPLAIGADALARAAGTFSTGLLAVGIAHVASLAWLRGRQRAAYSAAILLAGVLSAAFVALAAAAVTAATTQPATAAALLAAALAAVLGAAGYGVAAAGLVVELRAEGRA